MKEHGLIPINHGDKDDGISSTNTDENLKECIQQLINHGTIHIGHFDKKKKGKMMVIIEIPYTTSKM